VPAPTDTGANRERFALATSYLASMDRRQAVRRWLLAAGAACALACCLAPAAALGTVGFGLLSGDHGCLVRPGSEDNEHALHGCGEGKGLSSPTAVAVSPDGLNVYVASGTSGNTLAESFGSIAIMKRDPGTGAITELACISSDGTDGRDGASGACAVSSGLLGADGVAVSPDGTLVFVTASTSGSVVAFTRNSETGGLTRLGCFQSRPPAGSTCVASNTFLGAGSIVVSADGKALYVASPRAGSISTLAAGAAETEGATLAALFGQVGPRAFFANPCIAVNGLDGGCEVGVATSGLEDLTLSPDGQQLYGVAPTSGAVDVFSHDTAGVLTQTSCLMASAPPGLCKASKLLGSPTAIAISPDGANGYVADDELGRVIVLDRSATTGALSDGSCLDDLAEESKEEGEEEESEGSEEASEPDPCTSVPGLAGVDSIAVSGDGSAVYAIGDGSAVVLSRDPASGALKEASCASDEDKRCTSFPSVESTAGTAISPDGHDVYVTDPGDNAVLVLGIGATVQTPSASATAAGLAHISVYCPRALSRPCSGHLALTRAQSAKLAKGKRHHHRVVRVTGGTSSHYVIAPGHRSEVLVRLTSAMRRLLRTNHQLHLMTVVHADPLTGGSGDGRALAITLR
jgi:DNA-binding beta-propeller fold protein YncE